MSTALVFSGSSTDPEPMTEPSVVRLLGTLEVSFVIAADSGLRSARRYGVTVDALVGDLDSLEPDEVDAARSAGVVVHEHPTDKDATDLELALDLALDAGATDVVVVGAGGGRLDHQLGELMLLGSQRYSGVVIEARLGGSRIHPVRGGPRSIVGRAGWTLSILPVGGPATVVTTGLRWPLRAERLDPGSTRGISNIFDDDTATVGTDSGCVLVIVPEQEK